MPKHRKARAAALNRARDAAANFQNKFSQALAHYPPPARVAKIFGQICSGLGVVEHIPLCNFRVRMSASSTLIDLLLQHYDRVRHEPGVRHFLFTATFNDGITLENAPEVNFARIARKVRRVLEQLGLDAICVFEFDVLAKKLPADSARLLLFHVHAVCWTRDRTFRPTATGKKLSALEHYGNRLGVPGVKFVSRKQSAAKHRDHSRADDPRFRDLGDDQNAWSIADIGRYIFKAPTCAKDRWETPEGRWQVATDSEAFGLKTALRFAEIWSQITPANAVFGVGAEGGALARQFSNRMRQLGAELPTLRKSSLSRNEIRSAWRIYFQAYPKLGFEPAVIKQRSVI